MSGITSTVVSSSDGATGKSQGRADYGTMTIAGQTFGYGPEGYVAAGTPGRDPRAARTTRPPRSRPSASRCSCPKPSYKADGDKASGTIEGLIVTIDLKTLKPVLSQLPLGAILAQVPFPPEAALLKSLLSSIGNLSPKIVVHLGYTTAAVDTVQAIPIPTRVPDNDPTDDPSDGADRLRRRHAAAGRPVAAAQSSAAAASRRRTRRRPVTDAGAELADTAATSGLPPLFSIPGLLLFAGLGGALLAGSYVRRLGAMVLGAGGACPHGLESGLPDLRKVQ